jgi:putative ABC transport system permease protein
MNFLSDVRYALRSMARVPLFAATVIVVLGVGIGANTAMLRIVDGVLLRPLPFEDPVQLVAVQERVPQMAQDGQPVPVNAVHFGEWRQQWTSAEDLALLDVDDMNLTSGGEPQRVAIGRVSWNLFSMLGIQPQLGRVFLAQEDQAGSDKEVILSDALWRRRFNADPAILGRQILLNDVSFEVVGVMPAGLQLPKVSELQSMAFGSQVPDIWKPFGLTDDERSPMGDFNYACIARLKAGASIQEALQQLNGVQANISQKMADNIELQAVLSPLQEQMTGRSRQSLTLLQLAVGTVLLIVCINVANLLLARATGRQREFAIRTAIGASTSRLVRQALTESLVYALLGGLLGWGIAVVTLQLIVVKAPIDLPRLGELRPDGATLLMAFAFSLASAAICGMAPAWISSRIDPQVGLRGSGRTTTESRWSGRLRSLLVSLETGLCTVSLVAAGLLLNSFVRLLHVDSGFHTSNVMAVDLNMPDARYPDLERRSQFLQEAIEAARTLPGVSTAAVSSLLPLAGEGNNQIINLDGDTTPVMQRPIADFRMVSEDFFRTMGIPVMQGRGLELADRTHIVSVISDTLARRLWPNQNPLGKRFHLGSPSGPPLEVVGVAGEVRGVHLQQGPNPTVYLPYWQRNRAIMTLIVRTEANPTTIASSIRNEIHTLDPEMPVEFRTLDQIVSASVALRRFQLTLVLLFAAMALGVASLGSYGVVSHMVAQRQREMGIRMALGASGASLQRLILQQGLTPVMAGLGTGLIGAVLAGRALSSMLYSVTPADPLTLSAVAAVLVAVAALACYVPAARASRSDPLITLKSE